ncbi:MAG: UDP-N-acetylmuramate--alanine ligase [Pseudomonadota bacterium]
MVLADLLVFGLMFLSAMAPFGLATMWMQRGKVGYTLTLISVLGALLVLALFASVRLLGVHPMNAMSAAMLVFLPSTIGCAAGALLGWLIYRRRHGGLND